MRVNLGYGLHIDVRHETALDRFRRALVALVVLVLGDRADRKAWCTFDKERGREAHDAQFDGAHDARVKPRRQALVQPCSAGELAAQPEQLRFKEVPGEAFQQVHVVDERVRRPRQRVRLPAPEHDVRWQRLQSL